MRISVAKYDEMEDLLTVEIAPDMLIRDLKAIIASESDFGIKSDEMNLYFDGKLLSENMTLAQSKLNDYDVVTCQRRPLNQSRPTSAAAGTVPILAPSDPIQFLNSIRSNPRLIQQLRQTDPQLVDIIQRGDTRAFTQYMLTREAERLITRPQTTIDILDPTIQQRIEEAITMENVRDNMEHAYEHAPEFFGNIVMLYINCKVNGHSVTAFVDSGAQMTIMSKACAERCGIMRLIDRRYSGVAKGVGTQTILGRIHLAQLEIENHFYATSLSVLEEQTMDMLIGLDMLRRHRCIIDLGQNILRFENDVETRFLSESQLPSYARTPPVSPGTNVTDLSETFLRSAAESGNNQLQQPANSQTLPPPPLTAATYNSTTNRQSATNSTQILQSSPFPEKSINEVMSKGFTREQAIEELKLTNGDVMKAIVSLMTKSLCKPKAKQ